MIFLSVNDNFCFKMISLTCAPRRGLISGVAILRCLKQMTRNQIYTRQTQRLFNAQACSVLKPSTPSSTLQLLRSRTVIWPALRFYNHNSHGTSDKGKTKEGFSLRALAQAPKPALYLGFSGLIPFLSAPLLMGATQSFYPEVAYAQVVYGAAILSFLGGARWGFAIPAGSPAQPDWMNLANSVVPSLLAWLALLCRDSIEEGVLVVVMGLGLSLHYDLTLLPGYPPWFKALRTVLTLVATFSIVATLIFKKFCTEKKLREV